VIAPRQTGSLDIRQLCLVDAIDRPHDLTLEIASRLVRMRVMTTRRVRAVSIRAVARALSAGLLAAALGSCSSDDTLVAVNVAIQRELDALATFSVTITEPDQTPLVRTITPPREPSDGGTKLKTAFFERIVLPDSWNSAPATIHVEAQRADGSTLATADATADIHHQGAVVAYVTFPADAAPMPDAGTGTDQDAGH
jgi:hypothetical protein